MYKRQGKKLTEKEGEEFGLRVMQRLNDACAEWKAAENIDYSIYGTPLAVSYTHLADGLGMGIGFTCALIIMGGVRELLGAGKLLGFQVAVYKRQTISKPINT